MAKIDGFLVSNFQKSFFFCGKTVAPFFIIASFGGTPYPKCECEQGPNDCFLFTYGKETHPTQMDGLLTSNITTMD